MAYPYTEDFTGAQADLTTPWGQMNPSGSTLQRNFGAAFGQNDSDAGAYYVASIGPAQYTQSLVQFNGPANGSKYIYYFLHVAPVADPFTNGSFYFFWSDGGSDSQILICTSGVGSRSNLKTNNAFTYVNGDTIRFEIDQLGAMKVRKNGTIDTGFNVTNTTLPTGYPGAGIYGLGAPSFDNWEGGSVNYPIADSLLLARQTVKLAASW